MEPGWGKMFLVALLFHLTVFSILLFVPDSMPSRTIEGEVYEVNLVELPARRPSVGEGKPSVTAKKEAASRKAAPARRLSSPPVEEKPLVIAKRTIPKKSEKKDKPKESPTKLIDQALAKIEKKVKAEEKNPLDQALAKIEKRVESEKGDRIDQAISKIEKRAQGPAGGAEGGVAGVGIGNWRYQMEVRDWIRNNWSYPALLSAQNEKDLEAVLILKVKSDGKIVNSWFQKRSSNTLFDQSVVKAIDRSDPLPPFPPGYHKTEDEIEITFNLTDLLQK